MKVTEEINSEIIEYLLYAERDAHEVLKITNEYPELNIEQAYKIQKGLLEKRIKENNTEKVGIKLGLTSKAKQEMMGVNEPIYGDLHADMREESDQPISCSDLIHPKIEPEIAFFIEEDIVGSNISEDDILKATKYIAPALEIIDSRYKDFKFTLVDVVADNCSSSKFLVGEKTLLNEEIDLGNIQMSMDKNEVTVQTGVSSAVLGHPLTAMAWAANLLIENGGGFKKGDIVLSGAITEAVTVEPGDTISAEFDYIGAIKASFSE
ncbi:2-keto-4-pentenoate hydratase [Salinicoccus halitifaciens]|uniref:2-oxo-3-hexenedioate decarboxylase n=1 Tax=Salinicoccus halitifaciens TaxID=1073415 RepID=A0ABV2E886_9STAP|nr:fumarylacetoacetate hydrolase family protein [Salinicoccus halitifaciens]MCD2136420.1 fumarylacetoacetate hydrolase family protein [Salinicoccus halitifaciens]